MKGFLGFLFALALSSCFRSEQSREPEPPKLMVGIVVDQLRNDLIYRYWSRFGSGGFRRLVVDGFYFRNAHFNYVPTHTGPGHASVYTGTTPRHHGIIANDWYSRKDGGMLYCAQDGQVKPIGTESEEGKMSPHRLLSTTLGDELKLASVKRGKVFAVALKDRSAVLPAGHMADAAFWFDEKSGAFVSSSFYVQQLPAWLKSFNDKKPVQSYLSQPWQTLYPLNTYTSSLADDNSYESLSLKKDHPVFPYDFSGFLKEGKLSVIRSTPYGNSLTTDLAIACIVNEGLGKDGIADLISISYSSTDIIGHAYGPRSVEVEDTYLRLDRDLEDLLNTLDREVGKQNYTVFLTADHGACDVPRHLADEKIPAGYVYEKNIARTLREFCKAHYNDSTIIANVSNEQVFLDYGKMRDKNVDQKLIEEQVCGVLSGINGIAGAYPAALLKYEGAPVNSQLQLLQNGYNFKLSGDIAYIYEPGYMDYGQRGTSHGSGYAYDTHVPVIFFGAGIPKGEDHSYITITQIAPTVTELLRIARPSAANGVPLNNFFRR